MLAAGPQSQRQGQQRLAENLIPGYPSHGQRENSACVSCRTCMGLDLEIVIIWVRRPAGCNRLGSTGTLSFDKLDSNYLRNRESVGRNGRVEWTKISTAPQVEIKFSPVPSFEDHTDILAIKTKGLEWIQCTGIALLNYLRSENSFSGYNQVFVFFDFVSDICKYSIMSSGTSYEFN